MQAKRPAWVQHDVAGGSETSRAPSHCVPAAAIPVDELLPAMTAGAQLPAAIPEDELLPTLAGGSQTPVGLSRAASSCGNEKPQEQDELASLAGEDPAAEETEADDPAQGVAQRPRPTGKLSDHEFSLWLGPLPRKGKAVAISKALISRSITTVTDVYAPRQKGYGFIRFHCKEDAVRALEIFQESPWWVGGVQVEVAAAFDEKRNYALPADDEISVKVGNLQRCTEQELEQALALHGITTHVDIYIPEGQPYGFVRFRTAEDAQRLLLQGPRMAFDEEAFELELCRPRKSRPKPKPRP